MVIPSDEAEGQRPQWFGLGAMTAWFYSAILGGKRWKLTLVALIAIAIVCSVRFEDPSYLMIAPVAVAILFITWTVSALASMLSDSMADWLIKKVIRAPTPYKASHQILYFLISMLCTVPALFFISIGGFPGE